MALCGSDFVPAGSPHSIGSILLLAMRVPGFRLKHDHAEQALLQNTVPVPFLYQQQEAGGTDEPCFQRYQPDTGFYGGSLRRHVFHSAYHDCLPGDDACHQLENDPVIHGFHCDCVCDHQVFLAPHPHYLSQTMAEVR